MGDYEVKPGLVSFVESSLKSSVVRVLLGERSQTGFFVSRGGLVCTCYHGLHLFPAEKILIGWEGREYPAALLFASEKADVALLDVPGLAIDPPRDIRPLPISPEPPARAEFRHPAASLGFAVTSTFNVPVTPRLLTGHLTHRYDFGQQERYEIQGVSGSRGNSGAPVIDMHRLRVVGYVRASYEEPRRQIGDALTFTALLGERPELAEEWRRACLDFDLALTRFYLEAPFPLDPEHCPGGLVSGLASAHAGAFFEAAGVAELFRLGRYVMRAAEADVQKFLRETPNELLLLAGASGSGKTSLILNVARELGGGQVFLPVPFKCDGRRVRDLLRELTGALLRVEHFAPTLGQLFARCPDRTWVLLFDGLNECSDFRLAEFKGLVGELLSLARRPGVKLKTIISLRTEFFREYLQEFFSAPGARGEGDEDLLRTFQRDSRDRPYLEVGRINEARLPDGRLELEAMYERYRQTGLKPATTFEQLAGQPICEMLDRPFVLDLMMRTYNGAEIPVLMGRSSLLREIIKMTLRKAGIQTAVGAGQMISYLSRLAMLILRSPGGQCCLDSDLYVESWHKGPELEVLLSNTPLLEREPVRHGFGDESSVRFAADWTFEFFIARHLWGAWWRANSGKGPGEMLGEFHLLLPPEGGEAMRHHLLVALVFFAEWAATDDPSRFPFLARVMNDAERKSFAKGFMRECLNFFRVTYGFDKEIAASDDSRATFFGLLSRNADHFGTTGGEGFLDYIEYLENIGEDRGALLGLDLFRSSVAGDAALQARRHLSLALRAYGKRDINAALEHASRVEPGQLPSGLRAKRAFIVGRAYQFKEDFARAEAEYEVGRKESSLYAYRCEHQLLAFIPIMARSDFAAALAQLDRILEDESFALRRYERFESMLLRATCLFRLGRYAEAEKQLGELVRLRMLQRHKPGTGRALQALAEARFRKFERGPALETVDQAIEFLHHGANVLALARAYDVKANVLGLLEGDAEGAAASCERALELSDRATTKHISTKRWCLQTRAILSAVRGEHAATLRALGEAGAGNPYEKLQERFIILLARRCAGGDRGGGFKAEALRLRDDFRQLGLVWYPEILSLMLSAAAGEVPDRGAVVASLPAGADPEGLFSSHLYARIFDAP